MDKFDDFSNRQPWSWFRVFGCWQSNLIASEHHGKSLQESTGGRLVGKALFVYPMGSIGTGLFTYKYMKTIILNQKCR